MTELSSPQPTTPPKADFLTRPLASFWTLDWEKAIYILFVVVAIITRFWDLGSRVVSHDESLHTQYSYQYYNGDGYHHTPLMHGPFLFHITALSFWLFGDNDFTSRIPVALFGVILVIMPYFLRRWIGRSGALVASFLLLISPYITYYSRYIRHDIYAIVSAVIVFIAILHYMRKREEKYLWWFAIGLGVHFTTKEVSYIYVAIFGSFLAIKLGLKIITAAWFRRILPDLSTPVTVLVIGLTVILVGLGGQRVIPRMGAEEAPATATVEDEGFAANPDEATAVTEEGDETEPAGVAIMRWLQVAGVIVLSAGLFLAARQMRSHLDQYPEFDLVLLFTTLVLPVASPFLTIISGANPRDYTISTCQLAGQETMSAAELFMARASNSICLDAFLASGLVRSSAFLILTLAVSVLVGLWWNRRRWLIIAAIFHGIFLILYTSFFTNPAGWTSGSVGALGYWVEQQEVQRGNQPSFYYFIVLPLYEFLPLLFSLVSVRYWAAKHRLNKVIGYWLGLILGALLIYSLTNWWINREVATAVDEANNLVALIAAGLILLLGILFWFLQYNGQLLKEYDLNRSWVGLLSQEQLFGFVPFVTWWFILTWAIYSYAGEKMPWLSTHWVFPMALLTGWYFKEKWQTADRPELLSRAFALLSSLILIFIVAAALALGPIILGQIQLGDQAAGNVAGLGRFLGSLVVAAGLYYLIRSYGLPLSKGARQRAWVAAIFGLLSLLTIRFNYMASFPNADYTNEFLVYAHGAPATKDQVLNQLEELSLRMHGDKSIQVAYDNDSSWPFTWYLRDYPNRQYYGENPGRNITESPVILAGSLNWSKVDPIVGDDYEVRTHTFLWWPMEKYRDLSWNAIFGDPNIAAENRRGLGKTGVRQALWDIFFYRDYQKYGEVFGGTYTAGEWPLRHDLRMYIRKDVLATLWDHGIDAVAAEPPVDPYAEKEFILFPSLVLSAGEGALLSPRNVAIGPNGNVYVADSGNHRIQVFDADGNYLYGWGSFGAAEGQFNEPWGLAVDDQFVYIADTWNHRLQKFTLSGDFITTMGQSGSPVEGQTGGGLFFGPRDIVLLPNGNLAITDTGNHRIQIMDRDGNFIQVLGTQGSQVGQFNEPVGLAMTTNGGLYLADTWNGRIQQFSPDFFPVFEWPVDAWFGESINNKPYLAVDPEGRIYTTDPEGYRVLIFNEFGDYLGRFGQFGSEPNNFGLPNGIAIDAEGNIYIADAVNNRVVRYDALFKSADPPPEDDLADPVDEAPADDSEMPSGDEAPIEDELPAGDEEAPPADEEAPAGDQGIPSDDPTPVGDG